MRQLRAIAIWATLLMVMAVPIVASAISPLLAWREPAYIVAGFAGVIALALMLAQPLLAGGLLPGLHARRGRQVHKWVGAGLAAAVALHVVMLWITSPPDVVDVFLFRSPTWFSVWGVIAMWALFATAVLALLRRRLGLRPRTWRQVHTALAIVIVGGTVAHAMLVDGTMEIVSKTVLCVLVVAATIKVVASLQAWAKRPRSGPQV